MSTWTERELRELDEAYEVRVAGRHADGSQRTLTIVWHVVVDGRLYLRSVRGTEGHWYQGVIQHFQGFLRWGSTTREVAFTLDPSHDDAVDTAYVAKYGSGAPTRSITNAIARETTLRVDPR